jgi:molybdopterin/thiamine biosynthesis adenylyltransferase/rhodanese-related sulfurtransferase
MSRLQQLLDEARAWVPEVAPMAVQRDHAQVLMLDCRELEEVNSGQIPGALTVARGLLETSAEKLIQDKCQPIVVYCASGTRSLLAGRTLQSLGYENVMSLSGGIASWKAAGLPITAPDARASIDRERYLAQLRLPGIGEEGQRRLAAARVLLVGAGGLGSPVALYLAAAGVGRITLVDPDVVDRSNLQRQILHTTDRVGVQKVESAYIALRALNPNVRIERHACRFTSEMAAELLAQHDVVVDGTDNFEARYLINRACHTHQKACVHGSVYQWQGQVAVFGKDRPCYECVFPVPPTGEMAPNCAEGGVLGAVTGVVGAAMASETVKLLCGVGASGSPGTIVSTFDLKAMEFDRLHVHKDPWCACCGAGGDGRDGAALPAAPSCAM